MRSPYEFNAVIARYYRFDSMIMGTSMSQNFKCTEFDRVCGGYSQKLTVPGCAIEKLCLIMEYACKYHKIKAVMADLHNEFIMEIPPGKIDDDIYYSDSNFRGDFRDAVSLKTLLVRFNYYMERFKADKNMKKKMNRTFSRDDLYNWGKSRSFGKIPLARALTSPVKRKRIMYPKYAVVNIEKFLIPLVKNHPDTKFYFFLPPFTLFAYDNKDFIAVRKIVFDRLADIPNVELYDFQGAAEVVLNPDNYCDLTHYSEKISSWILEQIKAGNYRVTPKNRLEFDRRFESLLRSFDRSGEKAALISLLNRQAADKNNAVRK